MSCEPKLDREMTGATLRQNEELIKYTKIGPGGKKVEKHCFTLYTHKFVFTYNA